MWNLAVISLVLLSFVLGMCEFIMIGIVPNVAESLGVSMTEAGMLISWFALTYAISAPILSVWGSRFNRYRLLLCMTGCYAVGNGAAMLADSYALLLVDRLFLAALSGVMLAVSTTFAPDIAERKYLPQVMAWIFAGFSIAAVLGVPIGTLAAQYVSWQWIFLFIAIVCAADGVLMAKSLPKGGSDRELVSLREQISLLWDHRILLGMGIAMAALAGNYTWYAYVTPLLGEVLGISPGGVSLFLFLFGAMTIVSNLASGKVAAMGGMYILWPILAVETGVLLLLQLAIHSVWMALALLLIQGILLYIYNSSIQIYFLHISNLFHPGTLLMAGALLPMAANFGISIGTAVGSVTVEMAGLSMTPVPSILLMALSSFLSWYLMRPERNRLKRISYHHGSREA